MAPLPSSRTFTSCLPMDEPSASKNDENRLPAFCRTFRRATWNAVSVSF